MRLPFLRPKTPADQPAPRRGRAAAAAAATTIDDNAVQSARTRARRRLVGALVLLVIAIVGFPLLFETQPRPLPVDTPIEVARHADGTVRQGAIQPVTQQPEPASLPPAMPPPDAGNEVAVTPAPVASTPPAVAKPAVETAPKPVAKPAPAPTPTPTRTPAPPSAAAETPVKQPAVVVSTLPAAPAKPALAVPTPSPGLAAASGPGRYVVQVGAFNDAAKLNDARAKVEKLGLKTYTQPVDTPTGRRTRVRAGPFATREEADGAAAKIKRSGLPANILAL